jgi:hypothetical protein
MNLSKGDYQRFHAIRINNSLHSKDPRCIYCNQKVYPIEMTLGPKQYRCSIKECVLRHGPIRKLNELFAGEHEDPEKIKIILRRKTNVENTQRKQNAYKAIKKTILI